MKSLLRRFMEYVSPDWQWTGYKSKSGYGVIHIKRKLKRAHRVSFELFKGEIPDGMCVLHTCDDPGCVNPDHLLLGTQLDNIRDRDNKKRTANINKTTCKHGHKLTEDNVEHYKGERRCRTCRRQQCRDKRARDKKSAGA